MFATVTEADHFPKHFRLVCLVCFLTRIIWCVLIWLSELFSNKANIYAKKKALERLISQGSFQNDLC